MENAENGDGSPETAPGSKTPERSKRFLAFGIKRLAIPEEEIAEYLTYSFARQAALQLRYNNWSDTAGFTDEPKMQDFGAFVREKETQLRWLISDDHLILSLGVLPEDIANRRWRSINQYWEAVIPDFKSLATQGAGSNWLDELRKLCEQGFDQNYRGLGVREFYKSKTRAKREHAREVRRHIEQELFDDWRNGARSMHDLSNLLKALLESLDERLLGIDDKIVRAKSSEEDADNRAKANRETWVKMGPLGRAMGKDKKLLDAQGLCLEQLYISRTRAEGWAFAKQFAQELIAEITDLKGEVDRANGTIAEAVKQFEAQIAERCTDNGQVDLRQHLVRFYDPQLVKRVTDRLVKDEDEQRTQTNKVRLELVNIVGLNPRFALLNQRAGLGTIVDILGKISADNARTAHNILVQNPKERLLGVSIVEKLKERYEADPQGLRTYVSDLVNRAGNYLTFEPLEVQKVSPGIPRGVQTKLADFTVLLPKSPQPDFSAKLEEEFRRGRGGEVEIVRTESAPHEITLVSVTNLFPVRYVKHAAFLKEKYLQRITAADAERAKLELHTEGDGSQFPDVFVPDVKQIKKDAPPYLLLAQTMDLIQPVKTSDSAKPQIMLLAKDDDGFDMDPVPLGAGLSESLDILDLAKLDLIRRLTRKLLNSSRYLDKDARATLQQKIQGELELIKSARGNNLRDEIYKQFVEGGRSAFKILRGET